MENTTERKIGMGKGKKRLALCTAEKIELDLSSCWIGADSIKENPKTSIKTVALTKSPDVKIKNRIGGFFRNYNIIAYGFSDGSLNIDVVFLLNGYSCLCKADIIANNAKNITITLVSKKKPKGLMQELADAEITVEKEGQGIYHFQYMFNFQIVVSGELTEKEKTWLESLMGH